MQGIGLSAPMDLSVSPSGPETKRVKAFANESSREEKHAPTFSQSLSQAVEKKSPRKEEVGREKQQATDLAVEEMPQKESAPQNGMPFNEKVAQEQTAPSKNANQSDRVNLDQGSRKFFNSGVNDFDHQKLLQDLKKKEAMSKFMASLESELGISPQAMAEVMSSLKETESTNPSFRSMAKVLAKLDLEDNQVDRAAELYANFLSETGSGQSIPSLESVRTEVSNLKNPSYLARQEMVDQRRASIDKITAGFVGNEFIPRSEQASMKNALQLQKEQSITNIVDRFNDVPREIRQPNAVSTSSQNQLQGKEMSQWMAQMQDVPNEESVSQGLYNHFENAKKMASQNQQAGHQWAIQGQSSSSSPSTGQGTNLFSLSNSSDTQGFFDVNGQAGQSFSSESHLGSQLNGDSATTESDLSGQEQLTDFEEFSLEDGENQFFGQATSAAKGATSLQGMASMAKQDSLGEINNAQDIVDQTQVIVRNGGGEMKMKLNPDGLGEVDLKVDVQNGKVNVQMVTDNPEAKRVLEGHVADLKEGLNAHRLSVEEVKVDVSSDLAKDSQSDQQEAEKDYAREFARDFMDRQRQESGFFQQGFLATPFQKYIQQSRGEVAPIVEQEANTSSRKNENGNLHLVA